MAGIGRRAKAAARVLALASTEQKDRALISMAQAIRAAKADILKANAEDIADAKAAGQTPAFLDRLSLDDKRVAAMADVFEAAGFGELHLVGNAARFVADRWPVDAVQPASVDQQAAPDVSWVAWLGAAADPAANSNPAPGSTNCPTPG